MSVSVGCAGELDGNVHVCRPFRGEELSPVFEYVRKNRLVADAWEELVHDDPLVVTADQFLCPFEQLRAVAGFLRIGE